MTDRVDDTVKAIADPHRRALLDALRLRNGRTVSDLESVLPDLGRHAVLKHLGVLERAGLVTTEKVGRTRTVRLDPVPIVELARRWLDDYSGFAGLALTHLRDHVREDRPAHPRKDPSMLDTSTPPPSDSIESETRTVVASIVVEATAERIWQALTDPDQTARWFFGGHVRSDWVVGSPLVYLDGDGNPLISGEVTEVEENVRLAHTWSATWSPETSADPVSHFEWLLEPMGALTKVTIRHSGIPAHTATAEQVEGGNVTVLSSLKTYVETGRTMAGMG